MRLLAKYQVVLLTLLLFSCSTALQTHAQNADLLQAQTQRADSLRYPKLKLDFPLIDVPYHKDAMLTTNGGKKSVGGFFKAYANPSMQQSLAITTDFYSALHYGIKSVFPVEGRKKNGWKRTAYGLALFGIDYAATYAPGGDGWLHEEYHRAVMTGHHINSFNDMNTFPIGSTLVSVNHIKDADLIRFKKESPYDFIRMHVAGIEGGSMLIDKLQQNNFFYKQNLPHELLYALINLNNKAYVKASADPKDVDVESDKMSKQEKGMKDRDFTGFDMTGWAYDIFRPNDPYENREKFTFISFTRIDRMPMLIGEIRFSVCNFPCFFK